MEISNLSMDFIYKVVKNNLKKTIIISFVATAITAFIVLCIPNTYTANVKLAPEYGSKQSGSMGTLGNAAAMFGINLGNKTHTDALSPVFYPEIIASIDFIIPLMDVEVETKDGSFKGTYSKFITEEKKAPWWNKAIGAAMSIFKKKAEPSTEAVEKRIDPFMLTRAERRIINAISSSIECKVDDKLNTIEITISAQDPLVAATMANVVKERLQEIITEYRTEKVKQDYEYAVKFCETAHEDYIAAQQVYAEYVDKHQGVSRQSFKIEQERLQGEMQLAYSVYNAASQQKILAAAKLQEEMPVFTTIQKATVPLNPTEPKRRSTTARMVFISFAFANAFFILLQLRKKEEETDAQE